MSRGVLSTAVSGRRGRAVGALVLAVTGTVVLVFGAAEGNSSVVSLTSASQVSQAQIEDAYYHCLDVQVHSLVAPEQAVTFSPRGNVADLLRAAGGWLRAAPASDTSVTQLALASRPGPGTCHGFVVEASGNGGRGVVRVGTGASVAGRGPLPRPAL